mmetsp:Transcript_32369/g.72711  ORF Transcript_32369/g.72711 Transcript_32369/m.72711 type:complete len:83 (-) Transcript_32369:125-373(-)
MHHIARVRVSTYAQSQGADEQGDADLLHVCNSLLEFPREKSLSEDPLVYFPSESHPQQLKPQLEGSRLPALLVLHRRTRSSF